MTWWVLDQAIRESMLPSACKLVLRTFADQVNAPEDWDAKRPEAWDPSTHVQALTVWCDRQTLSHATGYRRNQLRLIIRRIANEYKILRQLQPARQHYAAHWFIDLDALRRRRDPWFAEQHARREARRSRRRRSGYEIPVPSRHDGDGTPQTPPESPKDREWRERYDAENGRQGGRAVRPQRAALEPSENLPGAHHQPPDSPEALTEALSGNRGLKMGPCFTPGFSPQAISPQVRGHDVASRADPQAPVTGAPPAADPSTVTVPAEPCASGDREPPPWCPPELRRTLTRMTRGEQGPRGGLAGVGDLLEGPPSAEDGHKTERDYRAVMREQIRRARAAGYDIGRRPWEDAP